MSNPTSSTPTPADINTTSTSAPTPTPYPADANPGIWGVLKGLTTDDFKNIGQVPCARNSFLYGIGSGVGAGALRFAFKGHVLSASNWAVATFCLVSAGSWEVCRYQMKKHHSRVHTVPRVAMALPEEKGDEVKKE
ncbi:hypothetical protein BCR44DRAFT_34060 [Catenaria anguillulae PL171]|uniref:Cytochrome c oxidase assembly protein COX20, mitochondrial n=1 Tax=Catenaria anguillulae PL171 TaxID=765915 RepID=A0A1Y2HUI2_9FUNG|nr:hypothetical protein BCR44DRAFT_34060 [Catenaria anguillulae PL171]